MQKHMKLNITALNSVLNSVTESELDRWINECVNKLLIAPEEQKSSARIDSNRAGDSCLYLIRSLRQDV